MAVIDFLHKLGEVVNERHSCSGLIHIFLDFIAVVGTASGLLEKGQETVWV